MGAPELAGDRASAPRVGVIGAGFMGAVHLSAWRAIGITPAALLARRADTARAGLPIDDRTEVTSRIDTFLQLVDVVDICTPTDTHSDFARAAARAGKATLCEKPLALTVGESLQVIEDFAAADVTLQVGHVVRFFPEYVAARAATLRGDIGEPAVLRLSRISFAPDRGPDSWFADERRSGGLFLDLMIHDLDYARWTAGEVTAVFARESGGPQSHGIAILSHASGAISHVEASWAAPAPTFRTSCEIAGSRGVLQFDSEDTAPITSRLHTGAGSETTGRSDVSVGVNPFETELQHFLDVVQGRQAPVLTALDGAVAVQLAAAAARSARDGAAVPVEPLLSGV